ncbi:MAG: hypothetical protein LBN27_13950 [Prevotellaceae bacterium]|jgi:hypothetical protein|nr:hypothetical protein [Prevotellaceae bacterium]
MATKKVIISDKASDDIGKYFENYRVYQYRTDMPERASHYSFLRNCLLHIDVFFDNIYTENGKKYIDIQDICTVEFSMENNEEEILVKNIYFKN